MEGESHSRGEIGVASVKKGDLRLIATCAFGLENEVSYELRCLGYEDQEKRNGRVFFSADWAAVARCNLWLRCSERVFICLGEFEALTFEELYSGVKALSWGDLLPSDAEFPVDGNSVESQLSSVPAIQRISKKAVVDALMKHHRVKTLAENGARHRIRVSLLKDRVTVSLDTSGVGLHKRGYRVSSHQAPLKETLAAALIRLSRWRAERPLADPFCGSGTIAIEGAMMARKIAPGSKRCFAAESWPAMDKALWREAREESRDLQESSLPLTIFASDLSSSALNSAREHARLASVEDGISFFRRDISDFLMAREYGAVVCNPPYGDRLGEMDEVLDQTKDLARAIRRHPSWSFFVFTAYDHFEKTAKIRADKMRKLYNGRIRCYLYSYLRPRSPSERGNEEMDRDRSFLVERWRDGLIEGYGDFLEVIMEVHPRAERKLLERLASKGRLERSKDEPPRAFRKLFRYLRSLD